jgi:hypothetical protein
MKTIIQAIESLGPFGMLYVMCRARTMLEEKEATLRLVIIAADAISKLRSNS